MCHGLDEQHIGGIAPPIAGLGALPFKFAIVGACAATGVYLAVRLPVSKLREIGRGLLVEHQNVLRLFQRGAVGIEKACPALLVPYPLIPKHGKVGRPQHLVIGALSEEQGRAVGLDRPAHRLPQRTDAAVFAENAARFKEETDALLQEAAQLNLPEGTEAEVFHEGFAYFAELFGMEIASGIFVDEYQVPSAKELTEAADEAREHKIQFFLTAADDGRIYAETLAQETGETITLLDPLTTAAEGNPSYTERMRRNIQAVAQHWKEAAA